MTDTEKLLQNARDIAKRTFPDPSESAVMDLFHELCAERDRSSHAEGAQDNVTLH
ncbi:hypothetical protein [Achromobacter sp. AONIH1]|uniref:hypothetical protein n=1 Tax=Achromobacter sp. AONIH1 TaxID=1758194 RepID=UPI0018F80A18|nr:hypothetical protein [Achromobacter sp. AONIH1]